MDFSTVKQIKHDERTWVVEPFRDGTERYKYLLCSAGRPTLPEWAKIEDFTIIVVPDVEDPAKTDQVFGMYSPLLDWPDRWGRTIYWEYESVEELTSAITDPKQAVEAMRAAWIFYYGDSR